MCANSQSASADIFSWFKSDKSKPPENIQEQAPTTETNKHSIAKKQQAQFSEVVFHYFKEDYQTSIKLIEVGLLQHGFKQLNSEDIDRLSLMKGACLLYLGMYGKSQQVFTGLLSKSSSEYVQAQTWFFIAKAGFTNKQLSISDSAYEAILNNNLKNELSDSQWFELLYLTAHHNMQNGKNWQGLLNQLPKHSIYTPYLWANHAANLFNLQQYEKANLAFTQAKQNLIDVSEYIDASQGASFGNIGSLSLVFAPWRWFDSDPNNNEKYNQVVEEIDALFDHINHGLAKSLMQQGDLANAIAVLQTIASDASESNQALIAFGWANARENRWQTAEVAWQYLKENTLGLSALQASYGLAYSFSQQDELGQAYFALKDTSDQIDQTIRLIDAFVEQTKQPNFFDVFHSQWPAHLSDIKLDFLTPNSEYDAQYLLENRKSAKQILAEVENKHRQLAILESLLNERMLVHNRRLSDLNLDDVQSHIEQTKQQLFSIEAFMHSAVDYDAQLLLAKSMASKDMNKHIERLDSAQSRQNRLASDSSRKRPLKPAYRERVERIKGLLEWQLMDQFVATKWEHQQQLNKAKDALKTATDSYTKLQDFAQTANTFSAKESEFARLKQVLNEQTILATALFEKSNQALSDALLDILAKRKQQLLNQSVNTKLAMLRIQDLRQTGSL